MHQHTVQPVQPVLNELQSENMDDDGRPKSTSSDTSIPLEDDTLANTVSNKKTVVVPSTMFEYIGPVTGKDMSHFKCLLGCLPSYKTNGSPKYISCHNYSRFNIRRHVKLKHMARLNQFDNETKNLHGYATANERQSELDDDGRPKSTSSDTSIPIEDDTLGDTVSNKKPVVVPSTMFEYIGPVTGTDMSHFKCLMGCLLTYNTNGSPKYISCWNNSRFNIRMHVKSKHEAKLKQFDNETKNLHGEPTKKRSKSSSQNLKQNCQKNNDISSKTVSCQTEFGDLGSNDTTTNSLKDKDHSTKSIGFKKPITVPKTMFQYIGPGKGTEMSLFKCLLGCLPMYNSNGTEKYISCANSSRFNLRRHVKFKHKSKLHLFNEKSKRLRSLKEDLPDKQSESARFQLRQMLNQQENPLRDKTIVETPHKSLSITEDSASSANSLVETARDKNLSVIESSPLPFVDVKDFLQMTLDVRPSSARGGNVPSCPSQQEAVDQSDSASENLSISSSLVRKMYELSTSSSSSSKGKSTGTIANKDSSVVSRLCRSLSTPENENSCQEAKRTDSPSSVDIDYLHFPRAITVDPVFQDDIDEPDPIVNTPTALFRHSSRSSQAITKQAITMKELPKTVEGRSIKDGAQLHPHLIKPSALPLKELKLSPNESTAFQDTFEDQTPGQATAGTNSISEETNNELPEMEYSVESPEQEDSTVPFDVRFTSCQSKTSRKRTLIKGSLKDALEKHFDEDPKPSFKAIDSLARSLRLSAKVVRVWFANRRQKYLNPIAKSNRPGNRTATQAPVPCPIADGTADTAIGDVVESFTGNNSSTVEQITDSDKDDESIPASKPIETAMPEIISSPSNSTKPSETAAIKRTSGGSFKNGRPWGPLSRRQPVIEDQTETEQDDIEITETLLESTRKLRFAERLIKRCKKIGNQNEMDVYAIPLIRSAESDSNFERYSFGLADELAEHRTVLVPDAPRGADGSNRSKFINGIVNFIFGVEQGDSFRFQLIDEEEMNGVKVYDIHHTFSFRVSYSITIVAAPSYDTVTNDSQHFRDQNVAKMLLGAMEKDGGIQQLDMICMTAAVVDQSFMSIFGKDMAGSIYNWQPFKGDTGSWLEVIQRFCTTLADNTNPKSMSLTKQVLQERKQMEAVTDGLESLVKIGHGKIKEMDKAKQMIVFCDSQIQSTDEEEDKCFVVEMKKVELPAGEWVYNCNRCYVTCHDPFFKEEPVEDGHLNSENLYESTVSGYCSVCPDQCNLIMHSNQPYRWVSVEKVTKVSPDLGKIQRNEAEIKWKDIKSKGRDLIKVLEKDLAGNGKVVLEHFTATWRCIQRLNRIALRGNSFLTRKVFDVLYDAEQLIKELGFQDGLASLKN